MYSIKIKLKKRMKNMLIIWIIILTLLMIRIGYLQFSQGSELQAKAYMQQSVDRSINPKRGTIYDATRKKCISS